jgi:2-oxoglutarate ferredoxin oxidoreductase subunit alpha
MTDVSFRIGGQAGQGLQMISYALGKMFARGGYHAFVSQDVMSRIRGGHNFADVRICDRPVNARRELCDVLVALDERTVAEHLKRMPQTGVVVRETGAADETKTQPSDTSSAAPLIFGVPMLEMAKKVGKDERMVNSVALGALLNLTGYPLDPLLDVLHDLFGHKGQSVVKSNIDCARAGFSFAQKNFKKNCPCKIAALSNVEPRLFMSGAEAVGLSAILSGLQFYAGYPMSPSTPILEYLASKAAEHGLVVEQSEDEISAINMAIGASVAGARAMTGSSGGGFSLMVEGLSLAGMTETPLVIALCSRPGPATGLATRQAQADLMFAISAGHGEFDRVVLAPGTAEQAIEQTSLAFDLAEKYQTPAILLLDQLINESYWTVDAIDVSRFRRERYLGDASRLPPYGYRRYALSPEPGSSNPYAAVSPLLRPGTPNQVRYDDSDEHSEEGHITESAEIRRAMVAKRLGKAGQICDEDPLPMCFPDEKSRLTVLCFGSTFGVVHEAVERLREQGASVGMIHLGALWPFPRESILARLSKAAKVITVEGNATAQLARLVAAETRIKVQESVLRYDGRPFAIEQVVSELEKRL